MLETLSDSRKDIYYLVRISIGRASVSWQIHIFLKDSCPETLQKPQFHSASIWAMSSSGKRECSNRLKTQINGRRLDVSQEGPSPRPGHPVMDSLSEDARVIGYVTSGAPSPSLGGVGIAMAYLSGTVEGQLVWIRVSSRRSIEAEVVQAPFCR